MARCAIDEGSSWRRAESSSRRGNKTINQSEWWTIASGSRLTGTIRDHSQSEIMPYDNLTELTAASEAEDQRMMPS